MHNATSCMLCLETVLLNFKCVHLSFELNVESTFCLEVDLHWPPLRHVKAAFQFCLALSSTTTCVSCIPGQGFREVMSLLEQKSLQTGLHVQTESSKIIVSTRGKAVWTPGRVTAIRQHFGTRKMGTTCMS